MTDLSRYDYKLPRELIAQRPLACRTDARLMVVDRKRQRIEHAHVRDLAELLRPGDCVVLNDTKVVPARLWGYRVRTGGRVQGLYLEHDAHGVWRILCKTRGKLQPGEVIQLLDRTAREGPRLHLLTPLDDGSWAARLDPPATDVLAVLQQVGRVPLPPYIRHGEMTEEDWEAYQTTFARHPGSVAAPTAGLHFTPALLERLRQRGIQVHYITLHVGLGTFRPITTRHVEEHRMHAEWGCLEESVARQLVQARQRGGRVVAVGTTVVRVLETAARDGTLRPWQGSTDLFIHPPFTFHAVDALMTNFHLPRTTLLVLVCTFGGEELIKRAYQEAIDQRYRFYSYGDAMLVL